MGMPGAGGIGKAVGETIRGIASWNVEKKTDLLASVGLAFLFAAFFRALVGATTFQSTDEVIFLIIASVVLTAGLAIALSLEMPERLPVGVAAAMSGGAVVDSLVAAIIGRSSTVLLTLAFVLLGVVALGACWLVGRASGAQRFGSRHPLSYKQLAFPVSYLLLLVIALGAIFGCVFMVHVGGLNRGLSQLGFFVGCILSGAATIGLLYVARDRYLEVLAKAMLLFLIAGLSLILLFQQSFASLLVLAVGFCCFLALALRMGYDYYATFAFPFLLPVGLLALLFGSILAGLFLGRLLLLSGSIENVDVFTVAAMVLVNVVTVFGLGTNHPWDAAALAKSFESAALASGAGAVSASDSPSRPLWKEAVQEAAAEAGLTRRETEVLALMARGRNAAYIEEQLVVSNHTARAHILNIYKKMGLHSQQAVIDSIEGRVKAKREE